jgi:hypothetical protein
MPLRSSELEDTDSEPEPEPEPQVPRRRRVSFRQETTEWFFHPVLQPKSTVMMFWYVNSAAQLTVAAFSFLSIISVLSHY